MTLLNNLNNELFVQFLTRPWGFNPLTLLPSVGHWQWLHDFEQER